MSEMNLIKFMMILWKGFRKLYKPDELTEDNQYSYSKYAKKTDALKGPKLKKLQ